MRMFKQFYFSWICLLFTGVVFAQAVPKLRIDPANAYGGTISDYFDQVDYIPLETTKESLFGQISQLIITDSSMVITDDDTKAVLFFTPDGKFIRKVKTGEQSYPRIHYDRTTHTITLNVYNFNTEKTVSTHYDLTGNKFGDKTVFKNSSKEGRMPFGNNFFLAAEGCYYGTDDKPKDSVFNILKVYRGDSLYKAFLPYNQKDNPAMCGLVGGVWPRYLPEQGQTYVATPFDFNVYRITTDTAEKIYQVVFPLSRTMDKDIRETKNIAMIDSLRKDHRWRKEHIITGISNILIKNNYFIFKIDAATYSWNYGSENSKQYNFIYNLASGRLSSVERMLPDSTNAFLPIMDGFRASIDGLGYQDGFFYSSVSALRLFTVKEGTADKKPVYKAIMQNFFKQGSRKSNPVVVRMKIKDEKK